MNDKPQYKATVFVAELLRRTGRGPTGFQRHYTAKQCSRKVGKGGKGGYCYQHKRYAERHGQ